MAQKLKKKNTSIKKIVKKAQRSSSSSSKASINKTDFTIPNVDYVEAVGRRKVAVARVRLYKKPGDFVVNDKVAGDYFDTISQASVLYNKPFQLTETMGNYAVTVVVKGGGVAAQLDAMVLGIARCLIKLDPELRPVLKSNGLLTRDDRMKETRKIGMGGKARRRRQSPKR